MSMPDDYSTIAWRLDRIEETLRDLGLRVVSVDLYTRDRTEIERRLAEIERDIDVERLARKEADKDLRAVADKQGSNWRQAIYAGVIPGVLFLLTLLWQIKGGK